MPCQKRASVGKVATHRALPTGARPAAHLPDDVIVHEEDDELATDLSVEQPYPQKNMKVSIIQMLHDNFIEEHMRGASVVLRCLSQKKAMHLNLVWIVVCV